MHASPSTSDHTPSQGRVALTIGNFDGVHLGHRALIERCRSRVGEDGQVIALAFHPHPMMYLNPDHAPQPLEAFAERADRMMRLGVDRVVELAPTPELLGKSPQAFVDELIDEYEPSVIVEGHDFHFGKRRAGTPVVLKELAGLRGVDVEIVNPIEVALTDQSVVTASSTITRWLLGNGRVRDAGFVLGRPHELVGDVAQGDQLGRTIGFRTANIDTRSMLPRDGVYASIVTLPDGTRVGGAVNVGTRPTVQGTQRRAEVHLIDPGGSPAALPSDLPEYGWRIRIGLIGWVRDQVKFDALDALQGQLGRDVKRIAGMVEPMLNGETTGVSV